MLTDGNKETNVRLLWWGGLHLTARHYALWTKGLSNPTCSAFRAHRWPILVPLSREGPLRTTLNYHSNTHSRTAAPPKTPISVPTPAGPLPSSSALTLSPDSRTKLDPQRTNGAFHCGLMGLSPLHRDVIPLATATLMGITYICIFTP